MLREDGTPIDSDAVAVTEKNRQRHLFLNGAPFNRKRSEIGTLYLNGIRQETEIRSQPVEECAAVFCAHGE